MSRMQDWKKDVSPEKVRLFVPEKMNDHFAARGNGKAYSTTQNETLRSLLRVCRLGILSREEK